MGQHITRPDQDPNNIQPKANIPFFTWWYGPKMLQAIEAAEEKLGRPPTYVEAIVVKDNEFYQKRPSPAIYAMVMLYLFKEGHLYSDKDTSCYSVHKGKHEGFKNFLEKYNEYHTGYTLTYWQRIKATPAVMTVNLNTLVNLFRSKDEQLWQESQQIFAGAALFLDGKVANDTNKVAFASYPRSGNSFMRKYCELLTGISTGTDQPLTPNIMLQASGLRGESILDDTIWIFKTHYPWSMKKEMRIPECPANKYICIVRNPMDTFESHAHLYNTMCHSAKVPYQFSECYPTWWDWSIRKSTQYFKDWFKVMMRKVEEQHDKNIPILWLRFEDLVDSPRGELTNLSRFLINMDDITGTNAVRNVERVLAKGKGATQTYALKDTRQKFNKQRHHYTDEQYNHIKEELKEMIYYFGYADTGNNPLGFYNYGDQHDPQLLSTFNGYQQQNEENIKRVASMSPEEFRENRFDPTRQHINQVNCWSEDAQTMQRSASTIFHYKSCALYPEKYGPVPTRETPNLDQYPGESIEL